MDEIKLQVEKVLTECIGLIDELNNKDLPQLRIQVETFMRQLYRIDGFAEGGSWKESRLIPIEDEDDE